jgi:tetratricopeptide (TPR) repeat protein
VKPESLERTRAWEPAGALKLAGLAVALGVATWLLLRILVPVKVPDDFPKLPDLSAASPALRSLLAGADAEAAKHPGSAEAMGKLAIACHANEYPEQAAAAYRIAARLAPADPQWLYGRALIEEESGNQKDEFDLLRKTVKLAPDEVPALLKLADGFLKQEAFDDAVRYYDQAATASPKDARLPATFGLARVAARRQDWGKVIECVAPLTRDYPTVRPPFQLLQEAYEATGRTDQAAEVKAILLSGKFTDVPPVPDPAIDRLTAQSYSSTRLLKAAGLQSRFGHPERGVQIARRAADANPADADIRNYIAQTQLTFYGDRADAVDDALTQLAETLRLKPDDPTPLWIFTNAFFEQPKTPAAVERLHALLRPYAGHGETHFYLGLVAEAQGQPQEAIAQYQAALRNDPKDARVYNKLGLIWSGAGKFDAAIASLRKATQLDPLNTVARFNLGLTLMQLEKYDQGLAELREVLKLHPRDAPTQFCMGFGLLYSGRPDQAAERFREGLRYKPDDAEAHYGLASALSAGHKREDAVAELREALRLRPNYPEAQQLLQQIGR